MKYFILIIVMFSAFANISCYREETTEEVEAIISKSFALERVNKLCMEIPKPDNFNFVKKGIGGNSITASIVFYYLSYDKREQIREFYRKWAMENGWQLSEGNEYSKGKQTITIEFESINNSNVEISCSEPRK